MTLAMDGELDFNDLLAFLKGVHGATSTVIQRATEDKYFQNYLAMWVYLPLKKLLDYYTSHVKDMVIIPRWLFRE